MTKKIQTAMEPREIYQLYLRIAKESETDRELTAEELAKIKALYPHITDEKAVEIEAKYPLHTKGFPDAILRWVEHQAKNNKKFTDLKRRQLLRFITVLKERFERLDHLGHQEEDDFQVALMCAYVLGAMCPSPYETWGKTLKAKEKTKGRKPKWYPIADKVRADLAQGSSENTYAMARTKTAKRNFLHPRINKALDEEEMKPVSVSAVRDYLTYVDRERT